MLSKLPLCLAGLLMAGLAGCGSGDAREYGKLTGIVTLQGKPAPSGTIISFLNAENGAATSAQIFDGGNYAVQRAITGTYSVAFVPQGNMAAQPSDPDAYMKQIKEGNYQEPATDSIIPEKFRTPESSGLTVTVGAGENTHDFNL